MPKVYLVGAGPGATDLLTLRAARILASADIVFVDALVREDTIALAPRARIVRIGKRAGRISTDQRFIERLLIKAALRYDVIVRLKGGDPMLFGRAQEELDALHAAGIETEVVPGVSAAFAAASALQVSMTRRTLARSVTFATPSVARGEKSSDWCAAALHSDTCFLYMASRQAQAVANDLIAEGKAPDTPVVIMESVSCPEQSTRYTTLRSMAEQQVSVEGPALLGIGAVFAHHVAIDAGTRSIETPCNVAWGT